MTVFRVILVVFFVAMVAYTLHVGANHGWDLVPHMTQGLASMTWPGQFHLDFITYLLLSALWVAWRHNFSPVGIVLGLIASVAGMLFFACYLMWASFKANGDFKVLLLGDKRAQA